MNKYLIMPYNGRWFQTLAETSEMAYRKVCSWYGSHVLIAVMDLDTNETEVYHRELNENGNLVKIVKGVIVHED